MDLTRRSGVLLHPTSLPGPFGRGDLGPAARRFVDMLRATGQRVWQVLPLGPAGYGGSPYAASSAFAGDPLLVSPQDLVEDGLLGAADLRGIRYPEGRVAPEAEEWRRGLLSKAHVAFRADATAAQRAELEAFQTKHAYWLGDYALFAALKEAHGGGAFWACWGGPLARHRPHEVQAARIEHAAAVQREVFLQFLFEQHWARLHAHAREQGVEILGDVPIFVARDSADVWACPELFKLDAKGEPTQVAGVPPDDFTEDGQLWGNPLYDIPIHARTAYGWWIERFRRIFAQADLVRVDHFRGFASTYEVPAGEETARKGSWEPGFGLELFEAVANALVAGKPADLPVVAEDLGFITEDVEALLEATGFPGMKILQFAFYDDDPEHPFKPENHPERCVVYTGTHDNQTTVGWFASLDEAAQARVRERIGGAEPHWGLVELALASPAFLAIVPAQDLLGLDDGARFNTPGVDEGNWSWRLKPADLEETVLARLWELTRKHGRSPA